VHRFPVLLARVVAVPLLNALPHGAWLLAAPVLLFLFYLAAWWRIGPEPDPGPIVARYEPPAGMSAAAVRYVAYGTTDGRSFAAVIAALAVRDCIRVEPIGGKYRLSRLMCGCDAVAALAPEENRVLSMLFEDGPVIELSPSLDERNTAQNGRYLFHIHDELNKNLHGKYFPRHSGIIALGVLATFALALPLAIVSSRSDAFEAAFFTVWILFCGLILGLIIEVSFIPALKNALRTGVGLPKLLPGLAVFSLFCGFLGFMMTRLASQASPSLPVMLAALLIVNLGWAPLLKRRSPLGRQVADRIAGFRLFLEKVEHDPLDRLNPDEQLPRKLDSDLPFAIALEIKTAWGDRLTETFVSSTVMIED
jgi:hypothetical protein